jgi:hypothetical protein
MAEESEAQFDAAWDIEKDEEMFAQSGLVTNYFERHIIPAFKTRSAVWVLKSAEIRNASSGITNNASESMNAVLHSFQKWKQAPLDVICTSLFHLCAYYHREIERGYHQCGSWQVLPEFHFLRRDPSLMPFLSKVVTPEEIVRRARAELYSIDIEEKDSDDESVKRQRDNYSQMSLAREAINNKWVTLADEGCWIVRGTDGKTPHAVTIFPKETCSCTHVKECYHIIACKLMVGQSVETTSKIKNSMQLLNQKHRTKQKEKPSGRKVPRKKDFVELNVGNYEGRSCFISDCLCCCSLFFV